MIIKELIKKLKNMDENHEILVREYKNILSDGRSITNIFEDVEEVYLEFF